MGEAEGKQSRCKRGLKATSTKHWTETEKTSMDHFKEGVRAKLKEITGQL